jgi:SAM-dependent methyltransferase
MTAGAGGATFKQQEFAGWNTKAAAYDEYFRTITTQVIPALLDGARVRAGMKLLDVASGPGYVAGAAAERGANAVGLDFAPSMVAQAQKNFPRADFCQGDAEALQFASGSFDAVICGFGLGHLAEPDKAISEAFRVLRPGGRYAFSWWLSPDKHEFFALVMGAIKAHGKLDVPLPPAPPMFRFSDPEECRRALSSAGFTAPEVRECPTAYEFDSPQQVLELIQKSTVRTAMLLELQTREALGRIYDSILAGLLAYKGKETFRIGLPALIAAGTKPREIKL